VGKGVADDPRAVLPAAPSYRLAYRVCRSNPPVPFDFFSHFRRGIKLRVSTPRAIDVSKGVSLWETEAQARGLALRYPHTGSYIATVAIPSNVRQELNSSSGHLSVWAEPEEMVDWVQKVVRVS
jgi:hypothetical protein